MPNELRKKNSDGLIDTGTLACAPLEVHLRKIRLLAPQTSLGEGSPQDFQILVANGLLETPRVTFETQFGVGDIFSKSLS